ncbi:MAG: von Willebrand factor type A domain-containing protein, partial [Candidatus Hydrogenedentales bacterium]
MPAISDEQLVAYLLNELDADGRAQIERAMTEDDAVVARLAEFDGVTNQVARAAHELEGQMHLLPEQREALLNKLPDADRRPSTFSNRYVRVAAVAAIAITSALAIRIYVEVLANAPLMLAGIPDASEAERSRHEMMRRLSVTSLERRAAPDQEAQVLEGLPEDAVTQQNKSGATSNNGGGLGGLRNVEVGGQVTTRWNYYAPEDTAGIGPSGGQGGLPLRGAGGGGFGAGVGGADGIKALGYLGSSSDRFGGGINVSANDGTETRDTWGVPIRLRRYDLPPQVNRERYAPIPESAFVSVVDQPLSTFGLDVDTASFTNVRRMLQAGQKPPREAVR